MITTASFIKVFDISAIDDFADLLEHILNIIAKSPSELEEREELVRASELRRYDSALMRKTYRDPRLFTSDISGIRPERIYSTAFDDKLDIYENRFVVFLIDELSEEVDAALSVIDDRFFDKNFHGRVSFGRYGNYQLLRRYETDLLYKLDPDRERSIERLTEFSGELSQMKSTLFYQSIKPLAERDIRPTNLLIHDLDYSACFRHYLSSKAGEEKTLSDILRRIYQEREDTGEITYKDVDFTEMTGYFTYLDHGFTFQFNLQDRYVTITETSSASYVRYSLSCKTILFLSELILDDENIHIILPVSEDTRMSDTLSSLDFTLPYDDECPICHSSLTADEGVCLNCEARYVIFKRDGERYIWIQNLSDLSIGGGSDE